MSNQKRVKTKAYDYFLLFHRYKWLMPLVVGALYGLLQIGRLFFFLIKEPSLTSLAGILFSLLGFGLILSSLPMVAISAYVKQAQQQELINSTIKNVNDFDYFREKLRGFTPGEISVLANLRVETDKDLAAALQQLALKGYLTLDGGYKTTAKDRGDLAPSSLFLLEHLDQGALNKEKELAWGKMVLEECRAKGYIQLKPEGVMKGPGCLTATISIIGISVYLFFHQDLLKQFEVLADANLTPADTIRALSNNPPLFILFFVLCLLAYVMAYILGLPLVLAATMKGYKDYYSPFERTELGHEKAELVYGMKNYIHDFSNLSQAERSHAALWDDYLTYAMVLEENETIVKEVIGLRRGQGKSSGQNLISQG